ncbi:MAG: HAD family phosphatase [Rhodococcus sp.]|nr:HAD family phosphatase [Rhodococcus sp. (in: high G+C Gram-positive bacteria)]
MAEKWAAINIDGVLLTDTFSTIIHDFVVDNGGTYDENTERSILSQPQSVGGAGMARATGKDWTPAEAIRLYFEARAAYVREHPPEVSAGAPELLERLKAAGWSLISYGGLTIEHFEAEAAPYVDMFDGPKYVCTNLVRPGLREICDNVLHIPYSSLFVVDDVARVGMEARRLGMPFIGHPSQHPKNHQRKIMQDNAIPFVDSLWQIDDGRIEATHGHIPVS